MLSLRVLSEFKLWGNTPGRAASCDLSIPGHRVAFASYRAVALGMTQAGWGSHYLDGLLVIRRSGILSDSRWGVTERARRVRRDLGDTRAVLARPTQPEVQLDHVAASDNARQPKTVGGDVDDILRCGASLGECCENGKRQLLVLLSLFFVEVG